MPKSINCIVVDDEPMAREVLLAHLEKMEVINVAKTCKNAVEAFNVVSTERIDLIFLDINMPEISGLSFAKSITKNIKVIFTTAYREYAVDGFDLQAVDYLLKPISFERLQQAVNKFSDQHHRIEFHESTVIEPQNDFIFVRSDRRMVKINFSEIIYIESLSDYIKIHLIHKDVTTRETISNIEAKLPASQFLRVHRSYIVSVLKIESFTNEFIEINKNAIPISRSYKTAVLNKLENC
jgi:two-component system LytT family response regulator